MSGSSPPVGPDVGGQARQVDLGRDRDQAEADELADRRRRRARFAGEADELDRLRPARAGAAAPGSRGASGALVFSRISCTFSRGCARRTICAVAEPDLLLHRRRDDALEHRAQRRDVVPAHPPRQLHQLRRDQHALVVDAGERLDLRVVAGRMDRDDVPAASCVFFRPSGTFTRWPTRSACAQPRRDRIIEQPIDPLLQPAARRHRRALRGRAAAPRRGLAGRDPAHARAGRRPLLARRHRPGVSSTSGSRRSAPRSALGRPRSGNRLVAHRPGRPLPVRRRGHRPRRGHVAARACGRRARWRARGCTAANRLASNSLLEGMVFGVPGGRGHRPGRRRPVAHRRHAGGDRRRRRRHPVIGGRPVTGWSPYAWRSPGPAAGRRARSGQGARPDPAGHDRRRRRAALGGLARRDRATWSTPWPPRSTAPRRDRGPTSCATSSRWPGRWWPRPGSATRAGAPTRVPTTPTATTGASASRLVRRAARGERRRLSIRRPRAVAAAVARALDEDLTPLGRPHLGAAARRPDGHRRLRRPRPRACWPGGPARPRRSGAWTRPWRSTGGVDDGDTVGRRHGHRHGVGPLASILTAERTALNFLGHLSGVATLDPALRRRRRRRRLRPGVGHPQDDARACGPGEGGGAGRRRRQPPGQPVRLGAAQGQPPRA